MSDLLIAEAQTKAEAVLVDRYQAEFDAIYRDICVKRGLELVTVRRTIYKRVTPIDALTLERHGWERMEEDSL